ncbi:longitudinals lacking protein, isoforms N/O/W/X/Y isoform X5 [Drosophila santomea]|uniref:longitudinals lacking protein, isoforms N/O/W/X/Y isoform X5 n=1 Tax=Drosophila santomea TaxID=129105 RepID=UPI001954A7DA|nr:longitudinals lacking protein, isoforms N/O/W/X/Y isoform X5 [Drosophila santomea]
MDDDQQFCLRWNNHQSTLISVFDTLLENETLVDCTLAAEGKFLKAHKVVLSACSPYFATLLQEQYDKHPIFILKDVKYQELRAMMDYMYRGEVNISQDQLAALLKAAESLQIKGLSDNRTGGGAAPKPESSGHHRGGKLSGAYTLEQTKRARLATGGAMDTSGDVSGSREGSSSPSRRRRKVRRRSMENDAHDNSNSSVLQAAVSNQSILQQTGAGLAVSALVSTQLSSGPAAGTSSQASSTQQQQPLTSTNVTKKTESAKLTSSTAAPASGASASAAAVQQAHLHQHQQQAQTTSDAINTENVQAQSQGGAQGVQGDDEDIDEGSAVGGSNAASGPNPASASASAVHAGVVVKQLASVVDKSSSNHKHKIKDNSVSSVGSEMVIEPKAEYDDDAHDENVEDLTLDEEDMTMEELDQTAGTSQGGEGSSQTYATWQHDRSQDELGLMAQDAQQRDPQDGYWTILETVPYSIASAAPNQTLTTATTLSNGGSSLLTGATVVVELPPDDLGNPVGNIQYTIPALTKNATTNTNTTSLLHKPQATTIQIVKQQHQQQHQQHPQQHPQQQHQSHQQQHRQHLTIQQPQTHARQEYIKIDTSRLEDKMLLRDVMQYGATSIAMAPQSATTTVVSTHESGLLLADADEAERELELEAMKVDQHEEEHLLDDEGYVIEKIHGDGEAVNQSQEKLYINGMSNIIHTATTMTLQQDDCKYACNVCGKTYKIKGSLKRHKNYECGVEPNLKCPHCPHKCKYRSDLRKHMNQKHADSGEAILGT